MRLCALILIIIIQIKAHYFIIINNAVPPIAQLLQAVLGISNTLTPLLFVITSFLIESYSGLDLVPLERNALFYRPFSR